MRRQPVLVALLLVAPSLAAEWRHDRSFVLEGGVVTMSPRGVIDEGRVWIQNGVIRGVFDSEAALATALGPADAERFATDAWIFPGLINLHTHLPFNHQPLWVPEPPTRKFENRYQWQVDAPHVRSVMMPKWLLFGAREYNLLNEQTLYAEARALVGGTTALTSTRDPGIYTAPRRLVRNIEYEGAVEAHVAPVNGAFVREDAPRIRSAIESGTLRAWVAHVAEGVDGESREEFERLQRAGLVRREVVIVHGTGLSNAQLETLGGTGGHLVWAPTSNLLLYGEMADIESAIEHGVTVSLSNDWAPSGTHNLLAELKVAAAAYATRYGAPLPARTLVEMVTSNPARAIGWDGVAGSLKAGAWADLVVVGKRGEPFEDLVGATEEDVRLVLVGGEPLFGRPDWMERLKPGDSELVVTTGRDGQAISKRIDVTRELGDTTLTEARRRLSHALRLERAEMLERFLDEDGRPIGENALDERLEERFPAVAPHALAPMFLANDNEFFDRLRTMRFPHTDALEGIYRPFAPARVH